MDPLILGSFQSETVLLSLSFSCINHVVTDNLRSEKCNAGKLEKIFVWQKQLSVSLNGGTPQNTPSHDHFFSRKTKGCWVFPAF